MWFQPQNDLWSCKHNKFLQWNCYSLVVNFLTSHALANRKSCEKPYIGQVQDLNGPKLGLNTFEIFWQVYFWSYTEVYFELISNLFQVSLEVVVVNQSLSFQPQNQYLYYKTCKVKPWTFHEKITISFFFTFLISSSCYTWCQSHFYKRLLWVSHGHSLGKMTYAVSVVGWIWVTIC